MASLLALTTPSSPPSLPRLLPSPAGSKGPKRAHMGEESKFFYDEERKMWRVKGESPSDAAPPQGENGTSAPPSRTASSGSINTFFADPARGPGLHSRSNSSSSTLSGAGKLSTAAANGGSAPLVPLAGAPAGVLSLDDAGRTPEAAADGPDPPKLSFPGAGFTSPRQQNTRDRFVNPSFMSSYTIKSSGEAETEALKRPPVPTFMSSMPSVNGGGAPAIFLPGPAPVEDKEEDVAAAAETGRAAAEMDTSAAGVISEVGDGDSGLGLAGGSGLGESGTGPGAGAGDEGATGSCSNRTAKEAGGSSVDAGRADPEPEALPKRGAADALFSVPPLPEQPGPVVGYPPEPPAAVSGAENPGQPLSDQFPETNSPAPKNCATVQSDVAFFSTREDGAGPFDPVPATEEQSLGAGAVVPEEQECPPPQMFQPSAPFSPDTMAKDAAWPASAGDVVGIKVPAPEAPAEEAPEPHMVPERAIPAANTHGAEGAPWVVEENLNPAGENVGCAPESSTTADVVGAWGGESGKVGVFGGSAGEGHAQAPAEVAAGPEDAQDGAGAGEQQGYENEWYAMVYGLQGEIAALTSKASEAEAERDSLRKELEEMKLAQIQGQAAEAPAQVASTRGDQSLAEAEENRLRIELLQSRESELLLELEGAREEAKRSSERQRAEVKEMEDSVRRQGSELEVYRVQSLDLEKQLAGAKADLLALRASESLAQRAAGGDASELEEKLGGYKRQVEQLQKTIAFISVQSADIGEERDTVCRKLSEQEAAYLSLTGDMNDLLVCLGQESAKVQALEPHAARAGVDVERLLSRVEEEYGVVELEGPAGEASGD